MIRRFAVVGLTTAVCALSACTSSGSGGNPSDSPGPVSSGASTSARPTLVQPTSLPAPNNNKDLRKFVPAPTSCKAAAGGWQAGSTATNPRKTSFTYALVVYFTTTKGTVVGAGTTSVKVPAGKTVDWTVTGKFKAPSTTLCVLVGVNKAK